MRAARLKHYVITIPSGVKTVFRTCFLAACVLLTAPGLAADQAGATDQKVSGRISALKVVTSKVKLMKGGTLTRIRIRGQVYPMISPSTAIQLHALDCNGSILTDAKGKELQSAGSCDGTKDVNDIWWIWWHNSPSGRKWGFLGGSGKYAGISGGGTTTVISRGPHGQIEMRFEGTWTIK